MIDWRGQAGIDLRVWAGEKGVERLNTAAVELRDKWNAGSKDPDKFYKDEAGDSYIYDLTAWHTSAPEIDAWLEQIRRVYASISNLLERPLRVLDYGAGIGTYSLMLAELGAHVYACEINKDLADYMLWRAARHNMPLTVAPDTDHNMDGTYDMLVCIDTVEHLADPVKFAGRMSELLSPKSTMVLTWTFHQSGDMHPMHLTEEHLNPFLARLHHLGFDRMGQTWPAVFMRT